MVVSTSKITREASGIATGIGTSVSQCVSCRNAISASMVTTGTFSRSPRAMRPGSRIISPSSATISEIAPTGTSPASFSRSIVASV